MRSILEYLDTQIKGKQKDKFPETFFTDDIIRFLENHDFIRLMLSHPETYKIDLAYKKLEIEKNKNDLYFITKDFDDDIPRMIRFHKQGEISKENPIYCITTSKNGKYDKKYINLWKEYFNNNVKIQNNIKSIMIYDHPDNFYNEIKKLFN